MSDSSQKIQQLSLKQFAAFEKAAFEFCPGINVIIGGNSTGKTLMLKVMYAMLKICSSVRQRGQVFSEEFSDIIQAKLQGIFQLNWPSDLVRCSGRQLKFHQL